MLLQVIPLDQEKQARKELFVVVEDFEEVSRMPLRKVLEPRWSAKGFTPSWRTQKLC